MGDRYTHSRGVGWGSGWLGTAQHGFQVSQRRDCPGLQWKLTRGHPHSLPFWDGPFLPLSGEAWPTL